MPTCFVASWGKGKPVIGILGEFDALPMISQKALTPVQSPIVPGAPGHGCGHNMMGTAAIAAAIAVKRSMELNNIPGVVPGSVGHHWSTVTAGYGTAAWKSLNAGAKVMAATALDLLTNSKLLSEIKNEFAEYSKNHPYKSFLPEGAEPPLDLNKDLMDKYRNAMMNIRAEEQ